MDFNPDCAGGDPERGPWGSALLLLVLVHLRRRLPEVA